MKLTGEEYFILNFLPAIQKKNQKLILDELNHYKSKLAEASKVKMGRSEYVIKLEAKIELLQKLKNKLL